MDNEEQTPVFTDMPPTSHVMKNIKSVLVTTAQENLQITVMHLVITDGGNFEQIFYSGE